MTSAAQPDSASTSVGTNSLNPEVQQIIAAARTAPPSAWPALLAAGATALLLWCSFTPLDWGFLGWVALVPVLLLARAARPARRLYLSVYVASLAGQLATLQWMRLADPAMYAAWIALAVYLAFYLPVWLAVTRTAVHRFRVPLVLAASVGWVGLEYARAFLLTGFSWYYLGHTQYRWTDLIQVSDLVGAYGVSFLVAWGNACLAGLVSPRLLWKCRLLPPACPKHEAKKAVAEFRRPWLQVGLTVALVAAALVYGRVRRQGPPFQAGPRIALIQGNFSISMKHDPRESGNMLRVHQALTGMAVRHQPEIIVWPETMFRWPLMENPEGLDEQRLQQLAPHIPVQLWNDTQVRSTLQDMAGMAGAALVIGVDAFEAATDGVHHYNSAVLVHPKLGVQGRYDKVHRVIFGEYIPLADWLPWLKRLTPISSEFAIDEGSGPVVFQYNGWRLCPIICFEDTVPHLVRNFVRAAQRSGRRVDVLVNLTNDGWFHGSSELDQHLITALFRCVECRTPMVRAVNTGISAVIDGDGVVREPDVFIDGDADGTQPPRTSMRDPETGRWYKQLNAALVDTVPLDGRTSLYVLYGDWFAAACCVATITIALAGLVWRRRGSAALRR